MAISEDPVNSDDVMENGPTAVAMDSANVTMIATRNRYGLVSQNERKRVSILLIITFERIFNIRTFHCLFLTTIDKYR